MEIASTTESYETLIRVERSLAALEDREGFDDGLLRQLRHEVRAHHSRLGVEVQTEFENL
jgi:hypothetical protein